ncbi:TetR/AcrR family transcriptional regulator [Actinosynnema sp. NPDC023587]|uniref:TetR/AcrR family transcriptional regulator n=1 Tax=Actinosynnema sp. NPDC023587 TaxID=3154695 RepID=UPI0033C39FD4
MSERPYHHGDLAGALLDAAESLVRERGADGWSLREVSSRVGVGPSAAYHHFASRDALVRTLSGRVLARLAEHLRQAAARARHADPRQRLVAVGRGYVRWAVADPAVASLAFGPHHDEPGTPHPRDVLSAELDRLVTAGGLSAAARPGAEVAVWAAVHGLATLLRDGHIRLNGPNAVDREAARLVRAVLTGLAATPHPRPSRTDHRPSGSGSGAGITG